MTKQYDWIILNWVSLFKQIVSLKISNLVTFNKWLSIYFIITLFLSILINFHSLIYFFSLIQVTNKIWGLIMLSRKSEIILFYVELFLTIASLTLMIIILRYKPKKLLENKSDDIIIESFSSLNFIDIESLEYSEPNSNLGLTGRLILDCYSGKCTKNEYY